MTSNIFSVAATFDNQSLRENNQSERYPTLTFISFFFQFSRFETEKVFDTVQILGGGRTEESATTIATLSGSLTEELRGKSFTSASNFMIIKFRTDESEEKSGFLASWTTDTQGQSCGGDLNALASPQILASPGYDGR